MTASNLSESLEFEGTAGQHVQGLEESMDAKGVDLLRDMVRRYLTELFGSKSRDTNKAA